MKYLKGQRYELTAPECSYAHPGDVAVINEDGDYPVYTFEKSRRDCDGHEEFLKLLPEIKGDKMSEETTVQEVIVRHSDGVVISTDHVEFDGKKWLRTDLRATIKRYTEILNRPLPKVPTPGDKVRAKKVTVKKVAKKVTKKGTK